MKNIKNIGAILIALLMVLVSCEDILDENPQDRLSGETFWLTEADADAGLVAVYDALEVDRVEFGWASLGLFDLVTPIGNSRDGGHRRVAEGIHSPDDDRILSLWKSMYKGVVRANDFLTHVDDISFTSGNGEAKKQIMIGEARFLRAMYYYLLVEVYGDVPLFTTVPSIDDASAPRAPKAEVLALIKEDIAFAISILPAPGSEGAGRVSTGAAQALKVKVALYENDWNTAAAASEEIMGMGYALVPDYGDVININNEDNEEVIFDVEHVFMNDAEKGGSAEKSYSFRSSSGFGWTVVQPTRWLVDKYEVIDPDPVYVNEDPTRIGNDIYDYFEGRDPRMDHTIIRGGARFLDKRNDNILYPHEFEAVNHSQVGMHTRKYVIPGEGTSRNTDSPLNYIIFRYADILLNYLEAVAMRDGAANVSQTILDQTINAVRTRASDKLPLYTTGNITMSDIYDERIRELAMEGWTFFDMRRNGTIELNNGYEVMGFTVKSGTSIEFNPIGINGVRVFDPSKHYLWPIPNSERERGENLTQNPGYPQ